MEELAADPTVPDPRSTRAGASGAPAVVILLLVLEALHAGAASAAEAGAVRFVDATAESGLDFVHWNGMTGELYMVENMGGGAALFDYDGDGDLDLYLVQGAPLDDGKAPLLPLPDDLPLTDRLYRNDLQALPDGRLAARFTDVTAESAIPAGGYGMGVAAGDYDGDGFQDLYVTNWGPNRLLRNRGDGTFEDATAAAGVGEDRWSVPAVFFDMDGDGDLDLYVGNYLDFTLEGHKPCLNPAGGRDYCSPAAYEAVPDRIFRNRGDGTFEDATAAAGLAGATGKALGAVAANLDGDGLPDLYVANDQMPNHLWRNAPESPGTFTDEALLAGCAVNGVGEAEASMGVIAEDLDGDGDLDLFVTHLDGETHTLYENRGGGQFADATAGSGLGAPSLGVTGFGVAPLDADGDGRLDLLVANGAVRTLPARVAAGDPYPLGQEDQLFLNRSSPGSLRFQDASEGVADVAGRLGVGRGVAAGDVDGDGDRDAVVVENAAPARLLVNGLQGGPDASGNGSWLGVAPVGAAGRAVDGAVARLVLPGGGLLVRRVASDGSYAAASDRRALFHLGGAPGRTALELRVRWPGGEEQAWRDLPVDRYVIPVREPTAPAAPGSARSGRPELTAVPEPPATAEPDVVEQLRGAWTEARELARLVASGGADPTPAARAFGRLGQLFAAYELHPQARAAFENARRLAPETFAWHYYAGHAAQEAGDLAAAEAALRRALDLRPDDLPGLLRLGEVLLLGGRFAEAGEVYARAAEDAPGSAAAWAGLGRVAAGLGRPGEAVEHLERALELEPEATALHYPLALAYRDAGDGEAARAHLERRGAGQPRAPDPLVGELAELGVGGGFHLVRGDRAALEGRHAEAVEAYRLAVAAAPESFAFRKALGLALYRRFDLAAAAEELRRALALEPQGPPERRRAERAEVLRHLGALLVHLGRSAQGEERLREAVDLAPDEVEARLDLANLLGRSGRVEEAVEELSRLLERYPDHRVARTKRATALMDLERYAEALPDLEHLAAEEPEDAAAQARRAAALEALGRVEEARAAYLRVLEIEGGAAGPRGFAHLGLARLLDAEGRHDEALERYRTLLAEQPRHRAGHRASAAHLARRGRYREALERLEESLRALQGDHELAQLLARLLAAAPDPEVRDAERAVAIARRLYETSRRSDYAATLAMAHAAAGELEDAAAAQREAIRLAEERGGGDLALLRRQLRLYEAGEPWLVGLGEDLLARP